MLPAEAVQEIIKAIEAVLAEGELNQQQLTFVQNVQQNAKRLAELYLTLPEDEVALHHIFPARHHELNAPLMSIRGYSTLFIEQPQQFGGELSPKQVESMRFISRQANSLQNWHDEIRVNGREEREREHKATPQAGNLADILQLAISVLQFYMRESPIQLSVSLPENFPPILAAPYHLSHLIIHIVHVMAFELVEYGKIQISAEQDGTLVNLRIFCTGLTSSSAEIECLFVKEGRHLYRQRFEQYGGRIEFSREAGIGAAVHLLISIAKN